MSVVLERKRKFKPCLAAWKRAVVVAAAFDSTVATWPFCILTLLFHLNRDMDGLRSTRGCGASTSYGWGGSESDVVVVDNGVYALEKAVHLSAMSSVDLKDVCCCLHLLNFFFIIFFFFYFFFLKFVFFLFCGLVFVLIYLLVRIKFARGFVLVKSIKKTVYT